MKMCGGKGRLGYVVVPTIVVYSEDGLDFNYRISFKDG